MRHAQFVTVLRNTFASPTLSIPGKVTPPPLEGDIPDPASEPELRKRIQEWNDVAKFLRENVVQGRLDDKTGSYSECLSGWEVTAERVLGRQKL